MTSLTIENYVKTIYHICSRQENRRAATGQLAEALQVSPGTVTSMLKTLSESGLATYAPYEGVQLTERGEALALRILRRHRLIEEFLVRTLDLSWDEVHEEAEHMEHAVSEFLIDRIDAFLGRPETDPHGDPIPKADGTIAPLETTTLADLREGDGFRLVRVADQSAEFLRYLSETGLMLNTEGEVASIRPAAGIITLRVGEREITLGREAAGQLHVAPQG